MFINDLYKSYKKLSYKLRKTLLFSSLLIVTIISATIAYRMFVTTKNGNINISSIKTVSNVSTAVSYSDYYIRISRYSNKVKTAEYSSLSPVNTKILFKIADPLDGVVKAVGPFFDNNNSEGRMIFLDRNANSMRNIITSIKKHALYNSEQVAKSNYELIKTAKGRLLEIANDIFKDMSVELIIAKHYEPPVYLHAGNMFLFVPEFREIKNSRLDVSSEDQWLPYVAKWEFNQNDKIELNYLQKSEHHSGKSFFEWYEKNLPENNLTILKFFKNYGDLKENFVLVEEDNNKFKSILIDDNGHSYVLTMKAQNKMALIKLLPDFLLLSNSLNFDSERNDVENKYVKEKEARDHFLVQALLYIANINALTLKQNELGLSDKYRLDKKVYFSEYQGSEESWVDKYNRSKNTVEKHNDIKVIFGDYPSEGLIEKLNMKYNDKLVIENAMIACGSDPLELTKVDAYSAGVAIATGLGAKAALSAVAMVGGAAVLAPLTIAVAGGAGAYYFFKDDDEDIAKKIKTACPVEDKYKKCMNKIVESKCDI